MKQAMPLVALLGLLGGCPKYATYGYQYRMQQQFSGGEEPEPAPVEARQLLASAKTVAFFPPDVCVNTDPSISGRKLQELRANCGVLMSTLERAAQNAGYEVLSWQNLRGTRRAIEYAREANVDVLFEINEFEHDTLDDTQVKHTFAFFERHGDGSETPLQVATPVAQACGEYAFQADKPAAAARTGAIDIKTVSVVDGRDRWHYRKTEEQEIERTRPKVLFSAPQRENKPATAAFIVGSIALGVGAALLLTEQLSEDNPLTPETDGFDSGGWSTNLLVFGGLGIGGGIALHYALGGTKPPPATTLCNGTYAVTEPVVVSRHSDAVSSEFTFTHGGAAPKDAGKNLSDIQRRMLAQFIDTLVEARGSVRQLAPAPAPAPPPAPMP